MSTACNFAPLDSSVQYYIYSSLIVDWIMQTESRNVSFSTNELRSFPVTSQPKKLRIFNSRTESPAFGTFPPISTCAVCTGPPGAPRTNRPLVSAARGLSCKPQTNAHRQWRDPALVAPSPKRTTRPSSGDRRPSSEWGKSVMWAHNLPQWRSVSSPPAHCTTWHTQGMKHGNSSHCLQPQGQGMPSKLRLWRWA